MQTKPSTADEYIQSLPEDRKEVMSTLRSVLLSNLHEGFEEIISYGMISYVVPHSIYPPGYHCDTKQPLPFISIASQKNFVALYHMGIYSNPALLSWFQEECNKLGKSKLDMGKSCIRFKKIDQLPFELIAQLAKKISPQQWIEIYEQEVKK